MRRARRFSTRLVRWTSLCVCFTFVLSFFAVVPFPQAPTSFAQGQGPPNGQGTSVPAPPPVVGPPAANLPDIDQVRQRPNTAPQAPMHLPSMQRTRRKGLEPRNGRKVGDPGTTIGAMGASERKNSNAKDAEYLAKQTKMNTLRASANTFATSALNSSSSIASGRSELNHARIMRSRSVAGTSARPKRVTLAAPTPIGDDQYVQTFFSYALVRQPNSGEQLYWDDMLRGAYAKGQASMLMAARELGKTLFESAEYAGRNTSNHDYVQDQYETYLLREPDSGGWAYWEAAVPTLGREAVRRAFDECGEFIYDVGTVTPNGSASSAVSSLLSARVDPNNQPGDQLLARDCEWSVSLLGLPGRAGLDLGLGLSYSSLVWTRSGQYVYFDEDNGSPSPGFRLGFATIQEKFFDAQVGANAYLLITASGQRVELRQVGTSNVYEAADSSYLQLTDNGHQPAGAHD
jgi:hypothetical protein